MRARESSLSRLLRGLLLLRFLLLQPFLVGAATQNPLDGDGHPMQATAISTPLFWSLERLARLVDTSYCLGSTGIRKPFDCLSRCKEFPKMSLVTTWSTGVLLGDSCGFIAVDHQGPGAIVVAFRGTYSITNTIIDLATVPQKYVPYPSPDHGGGSPPERPSHECRNCTVHMGFLHSWKNAREVVLPHLKALRAEHPGYPIHLVGHSLGGSVACLAALELRVSLGWEGVTITTYGEPRVGNGGLARFIDDVFDLDSDADPEQRAYRRVTHVDDPVPLLPPTEFGFKSHGGEIFISKASLSPAEDDVYLCVGDEDARCSAGADDSVRAAASLAVDPFAADTSPWSSLQTMLIPTRLKLWQILFAHRDYFWRLGLCVPGGDPSNWGRSPYQPRDPVDES